MLGTTLLALITLAGNVISAPTQLQTREIAGVQWSIKDFSRACTSYPNACTYTFTIVPGGYTPDFSCTIVDTAYGYANPAHDSWYSIPCVGNGGYDGGWVISWGYNLASDSAVMTVLNQNDQEDSWFGWNSVSTQSQFPDVGPNQVYAVGTFN